MLMSAYGSVKPSISDGVSEAFVEFCRSADQPPGSSAVGALLAIAIGSATASSRLVKSRRDVIL
jgi:hypothetical protein